MKSIVHVDKESILEGDNKKTMSSLHKTFARLEKIAIEMCPNSEKSNNMSEKSRSSLRQIRKNVVKNKRDSTIKKKKIT